MLNIKCKSIYFLLFFFMLVFTKTNKLNAQDSLLITNLKRHVSILASDSLEGRGLCTDGAKKAMNYIESNFKEIGLLPFKGSFVHRFNFEYGLARVHANNIIGMIEGTDPVMKNEYIVIGAHYDHLGFEEKDGKKLIYNGADDNASGTSGVIELARIFKDQNISLKRSVLFIAFDAEESGLNGSIALLKDSVLLPEQVRFMFSLDMIGMYNKNKGLELNGIESLLNVNASIEAALKKKEIKIKKVNGRIVVNTDTAPFAAKGIPTVHVFTGTRSPYHKPEDDADLLDYTGMAKVVEFNAELIEQITNESYLLPAAKMEAYKEKQNKETSTISKGVRFNLGGNYHTFPSSYYRSKAVLSLQTGFFATFRINENLSFQPELLYSLGGSASERGNIKTHGITIPLLVNIGTSDLEEGRFYAFAGPAYNYNFAGKIGDEDLLFDVDYNRQIWEIVYGLVAEVQNIQVGIKVNSGIFDIGLFDRTDRTIERGIQFTMGYKF